MIDTHCHILPMCDDGPRSWTDSIEMARKAVARGITDIVATPHHGKGKYYNGADIIRTLVERLNRILLREGIRLQVWPGQELHISGGRGSATDASRIQPIACGKHVLIELPDKKTPKRLAASIEALRKAGWSPIIVHPERHLPFVREPSGMMPLLSAGISFQLTAPSLFGHYGKEVQRTAWLMANREWIHLLASDAHDTEARTCMLVEAYAALEKKLGRNFTDSLQENARKAIEGESLVPRTYETYQVSSSASWSISSIRKRLGR